MISCSNDNSSLIEDESNQIENFKKKIIPIFNGVWVLTDYINEIEKSKSPLLSSNKLKDIVTLIINSTNSSDSIVVGASLNNHEGYNFTTYFINGQKPNSLKTNIPDFETETNFYELGFESTNNKISLILYHYSKANKLIDKKRFTKIRDKQLENDASWGLQYVVNEKLFKGNYLLIDSTNSSLKISLKSNGSMTGHPTFKSYYVFTDFMGGPETILDGILFKMNDNNSKWFAFKIYGDTTFLYNTTGNEEAGELLQLDKLKYKLVRQK